MTIDGSKVGVADSTSMKASDTHFTSLHKMSDRSEMLTAESHREKFISQFMFGMREFTCRYIPLSSTLYHRSILRLSPRYILELLIRE